MSATKTTRPASQSLLYGAAFVGCATSLGFALENIPPIHMQHGHYAPGDRLFRSNLRNRSSQREDIVALLEDYGTGSDRSFVSRGVEVEWEETHPKSHLPAPPLDPSEAVATIRASLSLQIKELATVLGVERPTIYAWLRGTGQPQPQNRKRIAELLDLSKHWNTISKKPLGSAVRNCLCAGGKSLVALLGEPTLDHAAIVSLMRTLAAQQRERPRGIHEIAKSRGIDLSTIRKSQSEFDVLTGKPFDED